jgi:outer membrane protein assembly factor BamB
VRLVTSISCLFLVAGASVAEDWPQWGGPKRDGVWRETGITETFPQGGPKVVWRKPVGMGYAGPAVANGKVYVTDRHLDTGSTNPENAFARDRVKGNERVLCLDEKTGETLWKHEYPCEYAISYAAGPRCTPTVDGDRVYTLGAMGHLFCLDANTGKVIWSKEFMKDYEAGLPVWGFAAHPLVDGEKLICLVGGSNDRLVVAFDKKTGKEIWTSLSSQADFGYCPPLIFEFGGKRQLIIWYPRAVVGLDPESGSRLWSVPFDVKAALTVPNPRKYGEDHLFVSSFYNGSLMLRVGASNAEVVWRSKARGERPNLTTDLSSIMATPVIQGDFIYGVCSYGQLRCIKAANGDRVWETMQATRGKTTPPAVAANEEPADSERWSTAFIVPQGDRYFLFNEQGDLIIAHLTPKGYEEVSRTHLLDATNNMARGRLVVWMHPAFADKSVFARNDKEIVRVDLAK